MMGVTMVRCRRYGVILGTDKCFICKAYVLTREFYYFPCTHVFHTDCLHNQVGNAPFDNSFV